MANYDDRLKDYIQVNERVILFYDKYPHGSIQSEIVEIGEKRVVVKAMAFRTPDDARPGVGHSMLAIPGTTPYTRGSEVENAETSAWGRALAALGFEVKRSIASRDEIENKHTAGSMVSSNLAGDHEYADAVVRSNHPAAGTPISGEHVIEIVDWCFTNHADFLALFGNSFGVSTPDQMTEEQYEIWRNTKLVTLNNYNAKHAGIEKAQKLVSETHQRMAAQANSAGPLRVISEKQVGRLFAIAGGEKKHPAHDRREIIRHVLSQHGIESDRDIPVSRYEAICEEVAKAAE